MSAERLQWRIIYNGLKSALILTHLLILKTAQFQNKSAKKKQFHSRMLTHILLRITI